ncbi:uncharacterized protein LOC100908735 [Galendromus occidentalis]|uniref:Uncharacterized protein LOC100908735 n=1 Tax=Galendromus occidentalis TaxID=34638 RepID=A0AAJ6QUL9_9ACAR|nr:uncharacterized protein LOC100908735 [Galendromus occidentalis]
MPDTKFEEDKKIQLRKWADDNVWWIVSMVALTVLAIMICIGGSVLYDFQPAFMGVVATLTIFICLLTLMVIRRCALQGKIEEEPTIIQIAVEEALDGPPLFPHYQRRRSSVATIPRCSIPNMDMIIDTVRRQSIQGSQRRDSAAPVASSSTSSNPSAASKKDNALHLAPIAELPKTPTLEHISHGTSLPR